MTDTDAAPGTAPAAESLPFRAEIRQLLTILAHSLYTEREIFLRELISNASDALNRLRFEQLTNQDILDPHAELTIRVEADKDTRVVRVIDTGIGLTREEMIENLGTIAQSGAMTFLKRLEQDPQHGADIIGQFGVGFYSVFMVADEVRVISRSYQAGAEAVEWVSRGENTYTLAPADQATRGTVVELTLREDAAEFANTWRLEQIIRKHSDFITFPIYVGDGEKPVNRQVALWRQAPKEVSEDQYTEYYKQLTFDGQAPLAHVHLVVDAPVQARALLYVPRHHEQGMFRLRTDEGLQLYSHNVLIQENTQDLLPKHFRFVAGVVDSEDLPLNISRETVQMQSNRVMERIRGLLTKRVQGELERLAADAPADYATFWAAFSVYVKEGVASDPGAREPLARLLRYPSTHTEGDALTSLQEYIARMPADQQAIYYVLADNRHTAAASPHLDPFQARKLEVLYFLEPIDSFVAVSLTEFADKKLRNVDDPDIDLPALDEPVAGQTERVADADFATLLLRFREVLGDRVLEVREAKNLTSSPARLVSPVGAMDRDLQRVRRYMDQQYEVPKRILELNRSSPLISHLAARLRTAPHDPAIDLVVDQLYDSALLQEGLHPNPADMVGRIQQLMDAAMRPGAPAEPETAEAAEDVPTPPDVPPATSADTPDAAAATPSE